MPKNPNSPQKPNNGRVHTPGFRPDLESYPEAVAGFDLATMSEDELEYLKEQAAAGFDGHPQPMHGEEDHEVAIGTCAPKVPQASRPSKIPISFGPSSGIKPSKLVFPPEKPGNRKFFVFEIELLRKFRSQYLQDDTKIGDEEITAWYESLEDRETPKLWGNFLRANASPQDYERRQKAKIAYEIEKKAFVAAIKKWRRINAVAARNSPEMRQAVRDRMNEWGLTPEGRRAYWRLLDLEGNDWEEVAAGNVLDKLDRTNQEGSIDQEEDVEEDVEEELKEHLEEDVQEEDFSDLYSADG